MVDASVPDIDGVAAIIRLLREDPDAVIVICISRGQRALALEAMMVGAKDFITKPYDIRRLRRTINSLPMK
jgi:two-component system chemotaxis response regulator CheY